MYQLVCIKSKQIIFNHIDVSVTSNALIWITAIWQKSSLFQFLSPLFLSLLYLLALSLLVSLKCRSILLKPLKLSKLIAHLMLS